jgi:hypothetical protein
VRSTPTQEQLAVMERGLIGCGRELALSSCCTPSSPPPSMCWCWTACMPWLSGFLARGGEGPPGGMGRLLEDVCEACGVSTPIQEPMLPCTRSEVALCACAALSPSWSASRLLEPHSEFPMLPCLSARDL